MSSDFLPEPSKLDSHLIEVCAGLAIARAERGVLTRREIRDALEEAYKMGQESMRKERQ